MATNIKTLTESNGDILLPRTTTTAITVTGSGDNLDTKLSNIKDDIDTKISAIGGIAEEPIPRNADTLNGYDSNHYASKSEVSAQLADKALKTDVGLLSGLLTTAKTSIVNAINELFNSKANKAQPAWISPTLLNNWVAEEPIAYFKDEMGFVHVKGVAKGGDKGKTIFTLPVGYRPLTNKLFVGTSTGAINSMSYVGYVISYGIYVPSTVGSDIRLDSIYYKAEA